MAPHPLGTLSDTDPTVFSWASLTPHWAASSIHGSRHSLRMLYDPLAQYSVGPLRVLRRYLLDEWDEEKG